jgi:hypothetical protein
MRVKKSSVFLNVPFDRGYERQFLALLAAVLALGRRPRCVLELADPGEGRLARTIRHLQHCRVSLHDLSRAGRFNMPFELGLACAVSRLSGPHDFFVFHKAERRLDRQLTDLKGVDHSTHGGTVRGTITCVLEVLHTTTADPTPDTVYRLYQDLFQLARELKRRYRRRSIFSRAIFGQLVEGGAILAADGGLLERS